MEATSQWPVLSQSPTPMLPKLEISTSPLPVPFTALPSSPALEVIPTSLQAGGSSRPSSPIYSSSLPITDVALLPTAASLEVAYSKIDQPNAAPHTKISWCRDVLLLLERYSSLEPDAGPSQVTDKSILALAQTAAYILSELKNKHPEAKYLRATLAVSGALPDFVKHSRRKAFREFEASANGGFHQAWFNLGREYESVGDDIHAADCFNKGVALDVASCLYRMGIAHVLGQLNVPQDVSAGLSLLHRAATLSSLNSPQPAYAFALILLGEFPLVSIPEDLIRSLIPPKSSPALEAKSHLERAAYLHYPPAQYKLGSAYEFAQYPWPYDPLSSVEWYRMAGTMEAEMALSKWFLCGAEGAFEADERLAWVFAEKAASKGLVTAEFAMGYYCEVGVGGNKNLDQALEWYRKASSHGDFEASARLDALNLPTPCVLSRVEHNTLTGERLVRRRTHARMESEARAKTYPSTSQPRDHSRILENIRQETISEGRYLDPDAVPPTPPRTPDSSSPTLLAPQMPGRQRFSLVDPGFNSATTPPTSRSSSPSSSPSFRPPGRRTPTRTPSQNSEVPGDEVRKPGPVTFADMGIGSVTLAQDSKSDCVLM